MVSGVCVRAQSSPDRENTRSSTEVGHGEGGEGQNLDQQKLKKLSIVKKQSIKKTCLQPKETSSICTFGTTCGLGIERAPAACGVASACRKSCYICTEETALCFVHWEDILEGTSSCFIKHRGTQDGIFTAFCSNTGHQVGEITHPDHLPVELMVQNPEYLIYFTLQRWNQHTFGICL